MKDDDKVEVQSRLKDDLELVLVAIGVALVLYLQHKLGLQPLML